MKRVCTLALALLMALPLSIVAMAKPQDIDFPNYSSPVSLDASDVLEDNGYFQPGKTYYIPIMNGNYKLDKDELERYRYRVSVENLNEGGGSSKGGTVNLTVVDGYRYVKFTSSATVANKENVLFLITLDVYSELDKGYVQPETCEIEVGFGSTSYCSDSKLEVDEDAPIVEFSDSVTDCYITFPDKTEFAAVLVNNTKKNQDEGTLRKINLYSTTTSIQAITNKYKNYDLSYLKFSTGTTFQDTSILRIYAPGKSYLYSVSGTDELKKVNFTPSGNFMVVSNVRTLGTYVMSKEELPAQPASSGTTGSGSTTVVSGSSLTASQAGSAADTAFASGSSVRFTGVADVALDAMQTIASKASAKGITPVVYLDTMNTAGAVETRLYVTPGKATKAFSAAARLDDAAVANVRNTFGKWFNNKVAVLYLGQSGDYGMRVEVATKLNLTGMDTTKLYFYSYNPTANNYTQITAPGYWIDNSGYLHFATTVGNYIVVSQGALTSK